MPYIASEYKFWYLDCRRWCTQIEFYVCMVSCEFKQRNAVASRKAREWNVISLRSEKPFRVLVIYWWVFNLCQREWSIHVYCPLCWIIVWKYSKQFYLSQDCNWFSSGQEVLYTSNNCADADEKLHSIAGFRWIQSVCSYNTDTQALNLLS